MDSELSRTSQEGNKGSQKSHWDPRLDEAAGAEGRMASLIPSLGMVITETAISREQRLRPVVAAPALGPSPSLWPFGELSGALEPGKLGLQTPALTQVGVRNKLAGEGGHEE